jgi:hypothetical protein
MVYDEPCTPANLELYLFRQQDYWHIQRQLTLLLNNVPPLYAGSSDSGTNCAEAARARVGDEAFAAAVAAGGGYYRSCINYRARVAWCFDVMRLVSEALDATNVNPRYLLRHSNGLPVYTAFGAELAQSPSTHADMIRRTRSMDYVADALRRDYPHLRAFYDRWTAQLDRAGYRPTTGGGAGSGGWVLFSKLVPRGLRYEFMHAPTSPLTDTYTGESFDPEFVSYGSHAGAQWPRQVDTRLTGDRTRLERLFQELPGANFGTSTIPMAFGGTDAHIDYCRAWARTIVDTTMSRFVADATGRWLDDLNWLKEQGVDIGLTPAELQAFATLRMESTWNTVLATAGAGVGLVAAVPVIGPIVGALLGVFFGLVSIVGLARGAPPLCPSPPFKRTLADPTCSTDIREPGGAERVRPLVERVHAMSDAGEPVELWLPTREAFPDLLGELPAPPVDLKKGLAYAAVSAALGFGAVYAFGGK